MHACRRGLVANERIKSGVINESCVMESSTAACTYSKPGNITGVETAAITASWYQEVTITAGFELLEAVASQVAAAASSSSSRLAAEAAASSSSVAAEAAASSSSVAAAEYAKTHVVSVATTATSTAGNAGNTATGTATSTSSDATMTNSMTSSAPGVAAPAGGVLGLVAAAAAALLLL